MPSILENVINYFKRRNYRDEGGGITLVLFITYSKNSFIGQFIQYTSCNKTNIALPVKKTQKNHAFYKSV